MQIDISGTGITQINFAPSTVAEEVAQNVQTILSTPIRSVVLDRSFGVEPAVDQPLPVAKARLSAAYVAAIQKYEPRAEVISISFSGSDGKLVPTVRIGVAE